MKKINKKYIIFILILFISIGFAYLSTTLSISGLIGYKGNSWNIYFDNIQMITNDVSGEKPVINDNKDSIDFNITFSEPSEVYKFSVDVVNDGTIDAMLSELIKTGINSSNEEYLDYSVTYYNGDELAVNDLLKHGTKVRVIVNVEYKYTTEVLAPVGNNDYSLTLKYIQADDNANPVYNYYESDKSNTFVLNNVKANTLSNIKIYGKNEQTQYQGYNLLNVPSSFSVTQFRMIPITLEAGTYTFKFDSRVSEASSSLIILTNNTNPNDPNSHSSIYLRQLSNSGFTFTLTEDQASKLNMIYFYSGSDWTAGSGITTTFNNLMIYKGTDTKDYEPYVGGVPSPNINYPQEVKSVTNNINLSIVKKNIFDGELEIGSISSTQGLNSTTTNAVRLVNYIPVMPNTVYSVSNDKGYTNLVYEYDKDYSFIPGSEKGVYPSFTTSSNTYFIRIRSRMADVENDLSVKFQVEEGNTATEWSEYAKYHNINLGSLKLNGIDDYRDYIFNKDGDWYIHRVMNKFKLENNFLDYNYANHYYSASIRDYITSNNAPLCTHFRGVVTVGDLAIFVPAYKNSGYDLIGFNNNHDYNRIYIKSLLTSEELNNFIASNDIYIYYKLESANSYDEKITDTNLINQLNNLINNNLVDGTNYITVSSNGVVPDIQFDYVHE